MTPEERKAALKALKQERSEAIKANAAQAKHQRKDMGLIRERLAQGPATAPEIAEATGLSPKQAMWYLAAMRKYGQVNEAAKSGDFFNYELSSPAEAC
ncbi:MAG: FaeA/PapI family transcriptional regulator [Desulfarculaceae bacterium]|nr:FaeA/PapI family transcriptional regulator [Desulfarculaceae bacterium]